MPRLNPLLLTFGLCALSVAMFAQGGPNDLNATFEQIDRAAQSFKTMTSDIKRDTFTAAIKANDYDAGAMKLKRTKKDTKMLIAFTGTDAKTVVLEGETFKIFYPKTNVIQYWNLGKNRSMVDQFLLLGFGASSDELKLAYTITSTGEEKIEGQNSTHLVLIPKSADVLKKLKRAELWIAESREFRGLPLQQKFVTSNDGDFMTVTYKNLKLNPILSDRDLQLQEPKGVKKEYPQK